MSDKVSHTSSATRMKKMREKLKKENPDYQKEENRRISELRKYKKQHMSDKELEDLRRYERERKKLQREKKKNKKNTKDTTPTCSPSSSTGPDATYSPYLRPQSLGKAIWRTVKSLPKSPRKQQTVVSGLAKRVGLPLVDEMNRNISDRKDFSKVVDFYLRSDIVYTCPGMKDSMTVWQEGKKSVLQKHYLTMFLKEAFFIFKEENPDFEIGFSKFCSLRPKNVLLLKSTPTEQCKCIIHENIFYKLKALHYAYSNEFWKNILCDITLNSECWQNNCSSCCDGKLLPTPDNPENLVIWKMWEKRDNRLELVTKECEVGELFEMLIQDLPKMMSHVNLKRIQHSDFEKDKKEESTRILQIDFAMSFGCEYQNEVQSALWSRSSVLLFTAAVFQRGKCQTYLICSDTSHKDKDTIFVFIEFLYEEIFRSSENGDIKTKKEVIWSDGPASEFKNKFMTKVLCYLSKKYPELQFSWKYFATAHGKGVVDGVGGNVKRLVRQKMMSQGEKHIVQSAKNFADLASQLVPSTKIFYIGEQRIQEIITQKNPWDCVISIPGISGFHMIEIKEGDIISCRTHSLSTDIIKFGNIVPPAENLECGKWVAVNYEGTLYPGEITKIDGIDQITVNVMEESKIKGYFRWPKSPDAIPYKREEIIKCISAPVVVNSRGYFKFLDF